MTTVDVLHRTWRRPRTVAGWLTDVNHRSIGLRYILTAATFFVLGGIAALAMRTQLATGENELLGAERYDQVFSTHGITMMFLFAVPVMQGLAVYFVPLMIGTREMAFPRLNAFGYWLYLVGGSAIWLSFFLNSAPNSGWFNYPPLASARYEPNANIDVYAAAIPLIELSAIVGAVGLIATILGHRAPGMSVNRMPLFVWSVLVMAVMIVFSFPPLIVASLFLLADRTLATHFYNAVNGGDPLLWQHLFWFFGHPEVYVMLLPGLGIVTTIVATFTRRKNVGYPLLVLSFALIGAVSMAVWVHHMFTTGRPTTGLSLFSAATLTVVIPSGVHIFSVLATMWHGRVRLSVPLLFVLGFVWVFVLGGITGAQIASIPFDWQVHDTYFIVAHFHYTLLGGVVLPFLAGIYFWFPKITGRMLDDRLGVASFALIFAGINLTFFPMHLAGLDGMPRRVYTYPHGLGWDGPQAIATVGAFVLASGVLVYGLNAIRAYAVGPPSGANPWDAPTLEWLADSPPSEFAFAGTPVVRDAYPLWLETPPELLVPAPVSEDRRETLATSSLDAVPESRDVEPGPTFVPLVAAAGAALALLGTIFDPIWFAFGLLLAALALVEWFRPGPREWDMEYVRAGPRGAPPTGWVAESVGLTPTILRGVLGLCVVLGVVLATLISSYFYLRGKSTAWPLGGLDPRPPWVGIGIVALVLASAIPLVLARRALVRAPLMLAGAAALVLVSLVVLAYDNRRLDYNWATNATGSIEFALLAFAFLVSLAFVVAAAVASVYAWRGFFNAERFTGVTAVAWLGWFNAAAWVATFVVVYLVPHTI